MFYNCTIVNLAPKFWTALHLVFIFPLDFALQQYSSFGYSMVQYNLIYYSKVSYSTVQYSTIDYSTDQ